MRQAGKRATGPYKKGVPAGVVVKLAKILGRPKERLFKVLGLPRATVDRKIRANQRLSIEQGERIIGFSKLVGQVQVMVEQSGDPRGFDPAKWVADWLDRPLPALGGRCPADYMDTAEGQELVSNLDSPHKLMRLLKINDLGNQAKIEYPIVPEGPWKSTNNASNVPIIPPMERCHPASDCISVRVFYL